MQLRYVEAHLERAVTKWAKERFILSLKLNIQGNRFWPDRIYLGPNGGRLAFIEFKKPGGHVEPAQIMQCEVLLRRGFKAIITDDFNDAIAFLESTLLSERGP